MKRVKEGDQDRDIRRERMSSSSEEKSAANVTVPGDRSGREHALTGPTAETVVSGL